MGITAPIFTKLIISRQTLRTAPILNFIQITENMHRAGKHFIYALTPTTAFTAPTFIKLRTAQSHYVDIPHTRIHPNWSWNTVSKNIDLFTTLRIIKPCNNFHEIQVCSANFCKAHLHGISQKSNKWFSHWYQATGRQTDRHDLQTRHPFLLCK